MNLKSWMLASVASAGLCCVSPAAFGQITGKVLLDGQAPQRAQINMAANAQCAALHADPVMEETVVAGDNGELANVVVSLKNEGNALKGDAPKDPAKIDQQGCQYHPHVVAMMAGQKLLVTNSDPFLHNIHGFPFENPAFNFAQPNVDKNGKPVDLKTAERFSVKCDVHPWMLAHVNVFDHPFFAVTNEKGEFSIPAKGLPDGQYTLVFWQEKFGEQEGPQVDVKGGKAEVAEAFKMKQQAAVAPEALPTLTVKLASADKAAAVGAAATDAKAAKSSDECDHGCCADEKKPAAATAEKKDEAKKSQQQAKAD